MVIHEFGIKSPRTFLFFPGSCEPWTEFSYAAEQLAKYFHVILVTPDGHTPSEHTDFISVEKTSDDTAEWLKAHGITALDALYGMSFGGAMALHFLTGKHMPVKKAVIDAGTAPYTWPRWICRLICVRDYLVMKAGISGIAGMKLAFPPAHFARNKENPDPEYREIQQFLKTFSNRTIWNIFWSANNYHVPNRMPETDTEIHFWVGTEEWGSRYRDLKWFQSYLPDMKVVTIPGMMHGELVMMHPEEFARLAFAVFKADS